MQKGYSTIITESGGYADLHMHTKLSDGNLSVEELLVLCKRKGLRCISITDHDNLDSYNLAVEPAKEIGLEIIPGIEISAVWQGKEAERSGYRHYLRKGCELLQGKGHRPSPHRHVHG